MQPTLFDIESKEATLWHEIGFDRPVGAWFAQVMYGHRGVEVLGGARKCAPSEGAAFALVPELTQMVWARFSGKETR